MVHLPHGVSNAEDRVAMVRDMSEGCDVVVAWIARSQMEYKRGCELGMIEGWSSWEVYEHDMRTMLSAVEGINLVMLDATPDDIRKSLEQHQLPNTPEGRSKVYLLMVSSDALMRLRDCRCLPGEDPK